MNNIEYHIKKIENIILDCNERLEGNIYCDISPQNIVFNYKSKQTNLQKLAKNSNLICEIGFNAGHSALFMISANPQAEYVFFDLNYHTYTNHCFSYIKEAFKNTKISIIYGDSKDTLTSYYSNIEKYFDLIHIDGGHDYETLNSDFKNSYLMCKKNGFIVIDDTDELIINNYVNNILLFSNLKEVFYDQTHYHRILKKNGD